MVVKHSFRLFMEALKSSRCHARFETRKVVNVHQTHAAEKSIPGMREIRLARAVEYGQPLSKIGPTAASDQPPTATIVITNVASPTQRWRSSIPIAAAKDKAAMGSQSVEFGDTSPSKI